MTYDTSLLNSTFSDIMLVLWSWPWWESWKMAKIQGPFFFLFLSKLVAKYLPAHHWVLWWYCGYVLKTLSVLGIQTEIRQNISRICFKIIQWGWVLWCWIRVVGRWVSSYRSLNFCVCLKFSKWKSFLKGFQKLESRPKAVLEFHECLYLQVVFQLGRSSL